MTRITPQTVRETLGRYMLVDGYEEIVFDLEKSHGTYFFDLRTGKKYLDFFSFFASAPVGFNHPRLTAPDMIEKLGRLSVNNITNSDLYTLEMTEFVETFFRVTMPSYFVHSFYVAGGSLGVENALKAAMDWKVRKNFTKGYPREIGHKVMHFEQAFHGRSGYTLSLTNTADPNKHKYFTKFDWPRITNPKITFPLTEAHLEEVERLERLAVSQIKAAFRENPDDICAIIIEPIQGEGGDNHFRAEFFRELRHLASENDAMLIVDEVQTGVGITGKMWAHQHFGFEPDMMAFGKKTQVCGFVSGPRIDEIKDNVFKVPSRINSTWGGNLIDMYRAKLYFDIIQDEKLVENAAKKGDQLLSGLNQLAQEFPKLVSNVRGRGVMCAVDLPTPAMRDAFRKELYANGVIMLGCGTHSVRFRPPLNIKAEEVTEGLDAMRKALMAISAHAPAEVAA